MCGDPAVVVPSPVERVRRIRGAAGRGLSCRTAVSIPSFIDRSPPSVDLGLGDRRSRLEEVEVASLVGLGDVLQVERPVSTAVLRRRRLPVRAALLQFLVADVQHQPAGGYVQLADVAVLDEGEWAT